MCIRDRLNSMTVTESVLFCAYNLLSLYDTSCAGNLAALYANEREASASKGPKISATRLMADTVVHIAYLTSIVCTNL